MDKKEKIMFYIYTTIILIVITGIADLVKQTFVKSSRAASVDYVIRSDVNTRAYSDKEDGKIYNELLKKADKEKTEERFKIMQDEVNKKADNSVVEKMSNQIDVIYTYILTLKK